MITVHLIFVILALICFLFAAVDVTVRRVNLIAAGLFLWLVSTLLAGRP
jgi:hypothetical protein